MISDFVGARGRPWSFALVALVCALACLAPARLRAQDNDPEYKELIDQALLEFRHKNWPEARVLFRRAHERAPNARTLRGMGVVSYEMRDYVQAVRDLAAALVDTRQALTEQQRTECQTLLTRSRTFVGEYRLEVAPTNAALTLDGVPLVREPDGSVLLAFGEHVIGGSAPGFDEGTLRVSVQGGEHGELALRLVESAQVAPASPRVAVEPAPSPPASSTLPARLPSESERGVRGGGLKYTWVALGIGALAGGGAAAAWWLGDKELSDLDQRCRDRAEDGNPCRPGRVNTDAVKRYERLTNAGLGVSGAALVAAVVLASFEWPRERSVTVGLSPSSLVVRKEF